MNQMIVEIPSKFRILNEKKNTLKRGPGLQRTQMSPLKSQIGLLTEDQLSII